MQRLMKEYLNEWKKQQKRRRKVSIAVVLLVVLVVGTVANNLTEYGVTLTEDPKCGLEEHQHTEECYQDVLICGYAEDGETLPEDTSAPDAAEENNQEPVEEEPTVSEQKPEGATEPNEEPVKEEPAAEESEPEKEAESAAQTGHAHSEVCYETQEILECELEENEGHTHGEGCYESERTLACTQEESEGHTHGEGCYESESILTCEQEEGEDHEHGDECYETEETLTCEIEESEGHTHGDECYQSEDTLTCEQEESEGHEHSDDCYRSEEVLICGQEEGEGAEPTAEEEPAATEEPAADDTASEPTEAPAPVPEEVVQPDTTVSEPEEDTTTHTHTEACYERQLVCGLEEHAHTDECMIDTTADVEEAADWDAMYADVEWMDAWGEDLVTVAKMQIGYKESLDNFQIAEDGSHKGYTRYGAFAGDPYADWNAAFVNFCMHYAGLYEAEIFPIELDTNKWYDAFVEADEKNEEYLTAPEGYEPKVGDLIFFGEKEVEEQGSTVSANSLAKAEAVDKWMGIVSSYDEEKQEITVIEGGREKEVKENTYSIGDEKICAYLMVTELETVYKNLGELKWEDDQVEIIVKEVDLGAIPQGVELKVLPILKDNEETSDKYKEVKTQLQEKVSQSDTFYEDQDEEEIIEEIENTVAGFLAYDISFVNGEGIEIEPTGRVILTMRYKYAMRPAEIEDDTDELYVTVMHLEEDEAGEVNEVVDMIESEQLKQMSVTEKNEVESVEFETTGFSTFVLTWTESQMTTYAAAAASTTKTATMGAPEHHKYIKRNASDATKGADSYTLSLDVKGEQQKKTVDIMLIVDASASMKKYTNADGTIRYVTINNAINNMIKTAKRKVKDNVTIRIGIVEFSDGYKESSSDYSYGSPYYGWAHATENLDGVEFPHSTYGSNSKVPDQAYKKNDDVEDAVKRIGFRNIKAESMEDYKYETKKFGCGTNWQAGFRKAEEVLASRTNTSNETYVIFLTDGLPTARYKNKKNGKEENDYQTQGAILDDYYANGKYYSGKDKNGKVKNPNYKKAVNEWKASPNLVNSEAYVVYAGDDNCRDRCNDFAKEIKAENGATAIDGTNGKSLGNAFNEIINNIVAPAYTKVSITDTLSDDVDFAFTNPGSTTNKKSKFKVTSISADGKTTKTLTYGTDYTLSVSGKTFTVTIKNPTKLANNVTYRVQVDVIPSQKAIMSFLNGTTQYPNTGDAGTDGPGAVSPKTSGGQKGFYSNDNTKTYLTYSVNGKNKTTSPYEKPVIQVETTTRSVVKEWVGEKAGSVKVSLTAKAKVKLDGKTETWQNVGYINTVLATDQFKLTLNEGNKWTGKWSKLPKYYYYYDNKGNAQHTPVIYIVKEDAVYDAAGKDVTANYTSTVPSDEVQAATAATTAIKITNTHKGTLNVEKKWLDSTGKPAANIPGQVMIGLYQDGKPTTDTKKTGVLILNNENDWKDSFSLDKDPDIGKYTIKELQAVSSDETYDFQVDNQYYKGIEDGNVIKFGAASYVVKYSELKKADGEGTVTVTNSLTQSWQIIKQSSSEGNPVLAGAKFILEGNGISYEGESDVNGVVQWINKASDSSVKSTTPEMADGIYTLKEIQAPNGYILSDEVWTFTVEKGKPSVKNQSGVVKEPTDINGTLIFYYDNDVLYALPSAGGSGIYWYTISGVLLMLAGMLVLYKKKYAGRC